MMSLSLMKGEVVEGVSLNAGQYLWLILIGIVTPDIGLRYTALQGSVT
jgi:hypothetical protein